ncbi:MAG: hypothetical protein JW809_01765 [Pirellulales bacterium]|nr:hypothetical protein [Pirellulales bacterium]
MKSRIAVGLAILALVIAVNPVAAQQRRFADLVGPVAVKPVATSQPVEVPYITWGGDVATFLANGGLTTQPGTIFARQGLNIRLVPGDDFVGQVRNYLAGKSPFVRGTFRMLGQASESLGADPKTKPVIILQLTWSAGDHVVARESLRTLNDLKRTSGKKVRVALQRGGPHVGLLDDMLTSAQLAWSDVEPVWVADLTGPEGPAELFRKDSSVDACCVISPDMIGLTGGLDSKGSGAEGTVAGAHVLVSTATASRSIADVYGCRSDWFAANRAWAEKFVAGYLQASDELRAMRDGFEKSGQMTPEYRKVLTMAQNIFGKDVLPTLEVDAHGLLLDCTFVRLPGNISFFLDKGNQNGFEAKLKATLDLAVGQGYARVRSGFVPAGFDYRKLAALPGIQLKYEEPSAAGASIDAEAIEVFPGQELDDRTIVSFTVKFPPNQTVFSPDQYGAEINRVIQSASTFGNAAIAIVGHADPTKTLVDLVRAGEAKGVLKRSGSPGNYQYFLKTKDGFRPLDLAQTQAIVELIQGGALDGVDPSPRQTMQAALNLSLARAEAVKQGIVDYAKQQGKTLNINQVQPVGAGILEPLVSKPRNRDEAEQNMRVEFKVIRVPGEAIDNFDY